MTVGVKAVRTYGISSTARNRRLILLLLLIVLGSAILSLMFGAVTLSPQEVARQIAENANGTQARIFLHVRLPRTLAALIVGAALAASGTILQTVLNNALAGPNIIGVNAGAGFSVLLVSALMPGSPAIVSPAAFLGALMTSLLISAIAAKSGASRITLVLSGVAIGSILSACSESIGILYPDTYMNTRSFFIGGLNGMTMRQIFWALPYIFAGLLLALLLHRLLDLLTLGDEAARSLGLRTNIARLGSLAVASLLAGAAVSIAGLIGFVGLLVPHIARSLFGNSHAVLLPASMLLGAGLVTCCDLAARLIVAPYELPVGILLSFLGGPFFLYLLLHRRRRVARYC